ncbi:MAG: radical SAM protein [Bdellovibrionales bacterium]|nr:radical SAM protein [Bdellovibrionales bacterium]
MPDLHFKQIGNPQSEPQSRTPNNDRDVAKSSDTWCPIPWTGLGVRTVGDLRYCCHSQSSKSRGLLRSQDGAILNLKENRLSDGVNADLLKEVRTAMLKGERHSGCQRCFKEEDAGIHSRRLSEQVTWEQYSIEDCSKKTKPDGSISLSDFPVRYLDLRFGNKCNLKCRMCGPSESDKWYDLTLKLWNEDEFKDGHRTLKIIKDDKGRVGLKVDPYKWHESSSFWAELEEYLPQIERIYLAGGEPLLIDAQFEFLQKCIDLGHSGHITLEYNSNLTALNERIVKIWSEFKKVEVGISIDGIGEINNYIRAGSDWNKLEKNIVALDRAAGNFKLWIASTIQIYNLYHLPQFMWWSVSNKFQRINRSKIGREFFTPHPLTNPAFLAITTFPQKSKLKIREHFELEKRKFSEQILECEVFGLGEGFQLERAQARFPKVLDNYINIMFSRDTSDQIDRFWKYTNRLDEIHGTSFRDVAPETYELMKL